MIRSPLILLGHIWNRSFLVFRTRTIRRHQLDWTQLSCRISGHWGKSFLHFRSRTATAMDLVVCLLVISLYSCLTTSQAQPEVVVGYDCSDIWDANNSSSSGIYWIQPKASEFTFKVFCEMSEAGGWTLIQRHDGSDRLNFNRLWADYKNGFGQLKGEQWLGLDYIYALTNQKDRPAKLRISIGSFDGKGAYAEYNPFSVGNEGSSYKLSLGKYSGTAGIVMKAMNVLTCLLLVSLYHHQTTSKAQCRVVHGYDCSDIWDKNNASTSGIYRIQPKATKFSFKVFCEMSKNGGWTLIQRHDGSDTLDFDKTFKEYQNGFGKLQGEQWLGLDYIYALTQQTERPAKLRISIGSFDGKRAYAEYNPFSVGNKDSSYKLSAGKYSGTAGDAFLGDPRLNRTNQHGSSFGTWDHPTDNCARACEIGDMRFNSCGEIVQSGWWFNNCGSANLNGIWRKPLRNKSFVSSVSWPTWRVRESLKFSKMYLIHHKRDSTALRHIL